jgi:outer membrane receptor protein involved in Fe transport
LDLLSTDLFNFKVNYFYVRGLDTYDKPVLIPILNLNYTNIVKIHGHDVEFNFEFNFTRMTGVNSIGAKINF